MCPAGLFLRFKKEKEKEKKVPEATCLTQFSVSFTSRDQVSPNPRTHVLDHFVKVDIAVSLIM